MRAVPKALTLSAVSIVAALFVLVFIREAFFSHIQYFVIVPGAKVLWDGKPVAGWLHRGGKGRLLIVTRDVSGKQESYWVYRPWGDHGGYVQSCDDWSAPKFPLVPIGDVNPPCFPLAADRPPAVESPKPSPIFGDEIIAFTADDGGRITVAW